VNLKLNYKKTFLIGFGFFGISVMWTLYNSYVPIYLQAGSPTFDAPGEVGFAGPTGSGPALVAACRSSSCLPRLQSWRSF
jgi:hypothetical protein